MHVRHNEANIFCCSRRCFLGDLRRLSLIIVLLLISLACCVAFTVETRQPERTPPDFLCIVNDGQAFLVDKQKSEKEFTIAGKKEDFRPFLESNSSYALSEKTVPRQPFLSIRLSTPSDDIRIASLRLSAFAQQNLTDASYFCECSCRIIRKRRQLGSVCLVAESSNSVLLGTVECSIHELAQVQLGQVYHNSANLAYLREFAVHPTVRRQGIGRRLLQTVEHYAQHYRHCKALYLHVQADNTAARSLYTQAGFYDAAREGHLAQLAVNEFTESLGFLEETKENLLLLRKDILDSEKWTGPAS